jgi:hypothetical protein
MNYVLIVLIIILAIMVVVSLVRGIAAFLQTTKIDLESGGENSQALMEAQNRAMISRVKYQGLAIVVVAVLLLINR